jgi:hypothetical protein
MLTDKEKSKIVDRVAHQGDGMGAVMEEFSIDIEEIELLMEDANYERCPECENWVEAGELSDSNSDLRPCFNCQPSYGDDD